jgi:predicted enzyme related to lactoylglutathione lyase
MVRGEAGKERGMDEEVKKHGAFSWFELMTTDVEAAKKFYTALFGWETEDMPMEGMNYTVIKAGGKPVAGMMTMPPEVQGMPPMWDIYITVDDVDATAKKVEELGGKVLRPPADIPKVGRFCVLSDPTGAHICAITYAEM